ncbi:hypothetical protein ATY78_04050 [Rhizobium sp. R635]|nr:hypothetical protein ATY78_04050 [Rhizobium sp. R635]
MMAAFGAPDAYAFRMPLLSGTVVGARSAPSTQATGFLGRLMRLQEATVHKNCSYIGLAFKKGGNGPESE